MDSTQTPETPPESPDPNPDVGTPEATKAPPKRRRKAAPVIAADGSEMPPLHPFFKTSAFMPISREKINPAPYNPRDIDSAAQVKLKQGLRHFGMVEPLILNLTTGHLIGGHQRLKLMDQEIGRDHGYSVQCCVVELSETEEKELNVLLNNPGAQGDWDFTKLANLIASDKNFDIELAAFDPVLLQADLMATVPDFAKLDMRHVFGDPDAEDDAAADADTIREMKSDKADYKVQANELSEDGFYLNVVFQNVAEKERFCEALLINPMTKNVLGRVLAKQLSINIGFEYPEDPDGEAIDTDDGEVEESGSDDGEAKF